MQPTPEQAIKKTLANLYTQKRIEKHLSMEQVAQRAGVSRKTIWNLEAAVYIPSTYTIINISNILDVSTGEILWGLARSLEHYGYKHLDGDVCAAIRHVF